MSGKRLLWQLYPSYLVITLLALLAVGIYASRTLDRYFRDATVEDLEARARLLEPAIRELLTADDRDKIDALVKDRGPSSHTRITVILPDGVVVGDSLESPATMDNHAARPEVQSAREGSRGWSARYSYTIKKELMYVAIPVREEGKTNGNIIGVLRTSIPLTAIERVMGAMHLRLAGAGVVVLVLAAGVTLWVSRRISRPLEEIQRGAQRFAAGDLGHKLPAAATREVATLAQTMNDMAAQLDDRIRAVLEERNEREAVLASMVEGVLAVDTGERVISLNHAAAGLLAVDAAWAEGRSLQETVRNPELQALVAGVLSTGGAAASDVDIAVGDGEIRSLHAQGTVLHDAEGRAIGAVVVLHDVTRLKQLEQVRRDFVANVSHELKTPVTSIKGFVETLLDGAMDKPEDARRFLGIISAQADRLGAIIEDLLTLSRIEQDARTAEIPLETSPLADVLDAAIEVCRQKAAEKEIHLEPFCPPDLAARVNPALLEQAVVNLVDNAVKYSSPAQTVRIEAAREEHEIVVRVRDQGCGIAREHLPRIFERFYRVDRARSRELGGTGLGLAIVKHIAHCHNGRATVQSTPGEGSTFTIHLPGETG